MNNNLKILTSGGFLIALALLLINDHYLKAAFPGFVTGKLSDFSGLFMMAVLIYAVAGKYLETDRKLITMHLIIAAGFVIWKIAPVELLFVEINRIVPITLPARVKDPTDLIALLVLPVSYAYIKHFQRKMRAVDALSRTKRLVSFGLLAVACFAIIATSSGKRYDIQPNIEYQTRKEWPQIRQLFEQTLADNGVQVKASHAIDDSTHIYKVYFKGRKTGKYKSGKPQYREYTGFITLSYSFANETISIGNIHGWVINASPDNQTIDRAYMNHILQPFLDKLKQ